MIDTALTTLIKSKAASLGDRVAPSNAVIPGQTMPRLLFTRIGGPRIHTDDGKASLVKARYQLDIFADTLATAHAIEQALSKSTTDNGLDGYSGTVDGTVIRRIYFPELPVSDVAGLKSVGANQTVCRLSTDVMIDFHE